MTTPEAFLDTYKPEVRDVALKIRELVRNVLPDAHESVQPGYRTITYGTGPRMSDEICYIAPLSSSVNLGFQYGTQLPDPNGLLRGTGRLLRHIKFDAADQVDNPAVRTLLQAAKIHGKF
ncbi:DUF1801 domain-containing protein [Fibrisoma montanum]|uniref:DUF1801 domain-containing protein n=1 Tax=Fibrisoma montanum TaxID=2305895 RepID=A0A418MHS5_9BACT|nr:DUF1801 domain-containing protein [Fibrisoma montanum]RIV26972.1 DUF1801 domain-containing protein [Fibrisoma montanum]